MNLGLFPSFDDVRLLDGLRTPLVDHGGGQAIALPLAYPHAT